MRLSSVGYQPMPIGLGFLDAMPAGGSAQVVQNVVGEWDGLYDLLDCRSGRPGGDRAARRGQVRSAAQTAGLCSKGRGACRRCRSPPDADRSARQISRSASAREANRLFEAWKQDPNAVPGSLKTVWLRVIARNADAATWDSIHERAKATTGTVERTALYQLLGRVQDEALARRALDLALTNEPGKTISAGIISTVAAQHPKLAIDFVLAHLDQVNQLIDISGRSAFMRRLAVHES